MALRAFLIIKEGAPLGVGLGQEPVRTPVLVLLGAGGVGVLLTHGAVPGHPELPAAFQPGNGSPVTG